MLLWIFLRRKNKVVFICLNFLHKFINMNSKEENIAQLDNEILKTSSWNYILLQKMNAKNRFSLALGDFLP